MRLHHALAAATLLLPSTTWAQKKEFVELQRDVSILQDNVRTMQRSQDEMRLLLQQSIESINKLSAAMSGMETKMSDQLSRQSAGLVQPVATIGTKVDTLTDQFSAVREGMADLSARMDKLQNQITDVKTAVTTLQAPPAPPATGSAPATGNAQIQSAPPAQEVYDKALQDKNTGQFDLSLNGFQTFLQYYPTNPLAVRAQYNIGQILVAKNQLEDALKAFDLVLERFPEGDTHDDAHFSKANTLLKLGRRTEAADEFKEIVARYPRTDLARRAEDELKALGIRVAAPAPAKRRK